MQKVLSSEQFLSKKILQCTLLWFPIATSLVKDDTGSVEMLPEGLILPGQELLTVEEAVVKFSGAGLGPPCPDEWGPGTLSTPCADDPGWEGPRGGSTESGCWREPPKLEQQAECNRAVFRMKSQG